MALLWNTKTLQQETVLDDQVRDAIASGKYGYKKTEKVTLIDPEGKSLEVPGARVWDALNDPQGGYRIETQQEAQARQDKAKYGTGIAPMVGAAAAGAASTASFGLSDLAASELVPGARETLSKLRQYQPGATMVGEIGGVVVPMIASGGASLLAKGAGGAGSAVRAVSAAGKATEGLVERAIEHVGGEAVTKGIARQIVERTLPAAAGSAVEGAFYGAGQVVSESALGDTDLTAEHLIAGAGMGALLGGVGGGALGAGSLGAEAAVRGIGRGLQTTSKAIGKLWEGATGITAHPKLGEMWAKVSATMSGTDESVLKQLFRPGQEGVAARTRAVMGEEPREGAARKLAGLIDESGGMASDITEQAIGSAKLERVKQLVPKEDPTKVATAATDLLAEVKTKLDEMAAAPGEYGNVGAIKKAKMTVTEYAKKVAEDAVGGEDPQAKIYIHLDELKRRLGVPAKPGQFANAQDRFGVEAMRNIYDSIRDHLEVQDLYGGAAQMQRAINKQWVQYLNTENYFKKEFTTKFGQDLWDPSYRANPSSIRNYIDNVGTTKDDLAHEAMMNHVQSQASLAKTIGETYDLDPKLLQKVQRMQGNAEEFGKTLGDVRDTVMLGNQLRKLDTTHAVLATMGPAAVGYMVGDTPGAGIGAVLGALASPGRTIRQLAAIERATNAIRTRITSGVGAYVGDAIAAAGKMVEPAANIARRTVGPAVVLANRPEEREKRRDRERQFTDRSNDLQAFVGNPQIATDRLAASTSRLTGVAPKAAQAVQTKAVQAAQFLWDKTPKPPAPTGIVPQKWKPRQEEIDKWERYARAVDDPLSVVADLKKGKLTTEAAEALRTVYPQIFQEVVGQVMEKVAELGDKLPYKNRLQLSILLGVPLDRSTTPQFVSAMQQSYGPVPADGGDSQPPSGGKTNRKVDFTLAEKSQTQAQRIEAK